MRREAITTLRGSGMITKIEWCDRVWNPIIGCSPASAGCDHCYAARMATRLAGNPKTPQYRGLAKGGRWTGETRMLLDRLESPLRWKKPCRVFANSMGDVFGESFDMIDQLFAVMAICPQLTFIILTKRPDRMDRYFANAACCDLEDGKWPLPNVWLGVSVEDQENERRVSKLVKIPAAKHIVSVEPMLGPVMVSPFAMTKIDWLICGPETGPGARWCDPAWIEDLHTQCVVSGVPFFDKRKKNYLAREFPR
ncbi:MAG: phage Gp37/Gp68 family protein [Patescibacteria group bacterium]